MISVVLIHTERLVLEFMSIDSEDSNSAAMAAGPMPQPQPQPKLFRQEVHRHWQHLELVVGFSYFQLKQQTGGTFMGVAWIFLSPLLLAGIYIFIVVVLLKLRSNGLSVDATNSTFIFLGLTPWLYISGILASSADSVREYAPYIRQPSFPFRILPNVLMLQQVPTLATLSVVTIAALCVSKIFTLYSLPYAVAACFLSFFALRGIATAIGAIGVVVPDFAKLLPYAVILGTYFLPIFYLPAQLGSFRWVAIINPFTYMITTFKFGMTGDSSQLIFSPFVDIALLLLLAVLGQIVLLKVLGQIRKSGIDRVA